MKASSRNSALTGVRAAMFVVMTMAVCGCSPNAPPANTTDPLRSGELSQEGDVETAGATDAPSWRRIDEQLLSEHRSQLEGREPPGGWSGVPGPDLQWCMAEIGWEVTVNEDSSGVEYEGSMEHEVAMDTAFQACDDAMGFDINDYLTEEYLTLVMRIWCELLTVCGTLVMK